MTEIEKKVNELRDFIENHYTEKDEYPKYLYDILEDFIDMGKENVKFIKVIKTLIYILQLECKTLINLDKTKEYQLKFGIFHSNYCVNLTEEEFELIKEVLGNEKIFNSKKEK